ncbi:DUF4097 and DUF4098 domain-containing protein YvlB [Lentzea xinjiangensis]|uniref:DUF4097 and DUF4098 domain-containing protein YvlB n=1 Tax=Lentzea xinjiangensis TaxID=402600 RepID=A0A1H9SYG4_9PSEU|nr:DUF4097 family beta strand repeat-containing protein [Lentzea xinjiangensis]SER89423.1 DUF4097 and DUF4098 domain-containing protein YvlB [Lentzea xinjiangensis]
MPTFNTAEPIAVKLDLVAADVRITAGNRADTVVEVTPTSENEVDIRAAEQTQVEYSDGKLLIKSPKRRRKLFGRGSPADDQRYGAIKVAIELPEGSSVRGTAALGHLRATGALGDLRFKTAAGDVDLDEVNALEVESAVGMVDVRHVAGNADVTTAQGDIRIPRILGTAVVKNLNGSTALGVVTGTLKVKGVNGDIVVREAAADVEIKTSNGDVRIDEVVRGSVVVETARGSLNVGVRDGSSVWLALNALVGGVRNDLDDAEGPSGAGESVKVSAQTMFGNIHIRRA